jgi:TolB protein
MKTRTLILLLLAMASIASAQQRMAFERGDGVWVAAIDGTGQRKIADGQAPDISPDGMKLAFNTVQAAGLPSHRQIAIADLATGKVTIFKDVPSDNSMEPKWAPDGTKLLFTFYNKAGEMRIGIVKPDGTGFRDIQANQTYHAWWAPAWSADSRLIFGEDMENLVILNQNGAIVRQWVIEKIVPNGDMSGDERMAQSLDGKTLLMDSEMNEPARKDWDGPPSAIWTLDMETEKATRLTPKALYAWDCQWIDPADILFTGQPPGDEDTSIWRMSLTGHGKDRKRLVKNARLASVSIWPPSARPTPLPPSPPPEPR